MWKNRQQFLTSSPYPLNYLGNGIMFFCVHSLFLLLYWHYKVMFRRAGPNVVCILLYKHMHDAHLRAYVSRLQWFQAIPWQECASCHIPANGGKRKVF